MSMCTRHSGFCAYPANDHTRCSWCHRSWSVITGRDGESAGGHVEEHLKVDAIRARGNARKAAARRPVARHTHETGLVGVPGRPGPGTGAEAGPS
jgi:hypothetical protein